MTRTLWALLAAGTAVGLAATRGRRLRQAYAEEVASGSRPIEAVGTAVAAFVGIAPGR